MKLTRFFGLCFWITRMMWCQSLPVVASRIVRIKAPSINYHKLPAPSYLRGSRMRRGLSSTATPPGSEFIDDNGAQSDNGEGSAVDGDEFDVGVLEEALDLRGALQISEGMHITNNICKTILEDMVFAKGRSLT